MHIDRYVKTILTIIAVELLWIGLKDGAPTVVAQAQPAPVPVIIRGIEVAGPESGFLPVAMVGSYRRIPASARDAVDPLTTEVTTERALRVETDRPLDVTVQGTVKVEADRPLRIESVPYTPARGPGE
ncbi:MAG TPA: hypothetical protein VIY56_03330 [Vicinamibacterales bacterium]